MQNDLLTSCQYGFVEGRSCTTQLLDMMEVETRILDDHRMIGIAYLDFNKAFDTVPHEKLIECKLQLKATPS